MSIESQIQRDIFSKNHEKTFIDKVLSRKESEEIRRLVKKPNLTRSEMLELLYLISSTEQKLLNYDEWNRYVILKYFVWLREFISVCEQWFDLNDDFKENPDVLNGNSKKLMANIGNLLEHNAKFLVDLYLNIGRSSLSINGSGFYEINRNKFEISYPEMNQPQEQKKGILQMR
jgi:hypothetical protein